MERSNRGFSAILSLQMNRENKTRTNMIKKNSKMSNDPVSSLFKNRMVKNRVVNWSAVPGISHLIFFPFPLSKTNKHIKKLITPIGTLNKNIDLQPKNPINTPPIAGPMPKPAAIATAYIPSAFPNSYGGKAFFTIPNETDIIIAAAIPCNALERIK